jgi:hypothetical protein
MTDDPHTSHILPPADASPVEETLCERPTEFPLPPAWVFDRHKPVRSIEYLLILWNLEIKSDASVVRIGAPLMADCPETVGKYLDAEPLSINDLMDEIVLACNEVGIKVAPRIVKAATYRIIRRVRKKRKKQLYGHLTCQMNIKDFLATELLFDRIAELFDMPPMLAKACIAHWIWQVKQKMLGRPPEHHMMLIIFSTEQGSGKTTFVRRLVSPLSEFASADVLLSDFADRRSAEIYRFPVVVVDDMEQLAASTVPIVKSLITSASINRRPLFTSLSVTVRQTTTLIGTANRPIHELIDDDTGHRRFVMMPFKNGDSAKGGDARIWQIVNSLDFEKLWLAVDAFGPSPIQTCLKQLHHYQNSFRPMPKVHKWLLNLDMLSEEVRRIRVRDGVRAEALRDLYVAQTGDRISNQKFSDEMLTCTTLDNMPFSGKQRKEVGALYIFRPAFDEPNDKLLRTSWDINGKGSASPKRGEDPEGRTVPSTPPGPSGPSGSTAPAAEPPDVLRGELEPAELED